MVSHAIDSGRLMDLQSTNAVKRTRSQSVFLNFAFEISF